MTSSTFAEAMWDHSSEYRNDRHWLEARQVLEDGDGKVLLIGPGPTSDLPAVTPAFQTFLERAGFSPKTPLAHHRIDEQRAHALGFSMVVSVAASVGSVVETLDLLHEIQRQADAPKGASAPPSIIVLLHTSHLRTAFNRILSKGFHLEVVPYDGDGGVGMSPRVGVDCLEALANVLRGIRGRPPVRAANDAVHEPASDQARRSGHFTDRPEPGPDLEHRPSEAVRPEAAAGAPISRVLKGLGVVAFAGVGVVVASALDNTVAAGTVLVFAIVAMAFVLWPPELFLKLAHSIGSAVAGALTGGEGPPTDGGPPELPGPDSQEGSPDQQPS